MQQDVAEQAGRDGGFDDQVTVGRVGIECHVAVNCGHAALAGSHGDRAGRDQADGSGRRISIVRHRREQTQHADIVHFDDVDRVAGCIGNVQFCHVGVDVIGRAHAAAGEQSRPASFQIRSLTAQDVGNGADSVTGVGAGSGFIGPDEVCGHDDIAECAVRVAVCIHDRKLNIVRSLQRDVAIFRLHVRTAGHEDVAGAVSVLAGSIVEVRASTQDDGSRTGGADCDRRQRDRVAREQFDVA